MEGIEVGGGAGRFRLRDGLRDLANPPLGLPALEPAPARGDFGGDVRPLALLDQPAGEERARDVVRQPLEERLRGQRGVVAERRQDRPDGGVRETGGVDEGQEGVARVRVPGARAGRGRARTRSRPAPPPCPRGPPASPAGPPRPGAGPGARGRSGRRPGGGPPRARARSPRRRPAPSRA